MKYVGLSEFLKLPAGTIYMIEENAEEPFYGFGRSIEIKGETMSADVADWLSSNLIDIDCFDSSDFHDKIHQAIHQKANLPVDPDPSHCRYGQFPSEGQVAFWVLDEIDVGHIIDILNRALDQQDDD